MTTMMQNNDSALQHWLLRWTMAMALILAVVLPQHAAQATDLSRRVSFDIPAQPLPAALLQFSSQSGIEFTVATESVEGRRAVELKGTYATDQALGLLLTGSGLEFESIDDDTVAIRRVGEKTAGSAMENPDAAGAVLAQVGVSSPSQSEGRGEDQKEGSQKDSASKEAEKDKISEIIVTAQKRDERLQDVPISISVLSGDSLDRSNVSGVTDALRSVPGVVINVAEQNGGTQVMVRGVGAVGPLFSGSSPTGYYLDAVPFGFVRSAVGPDSNAFDLDRVEVLRGPQGTLYGTSALNGVVRVLTKEVDLNEFDFKARGTLSSTESGGSENYRSDAAVNVPLIAGKLAARAVVGYESLSGWIDGPALGEKGINDSQLRNYRLKVKAQPTEALSMDVSFWRSNNDYGAPTRGFDDGTNPLELRNPSATDYSVYGANIRYELPYLSVVSSTGYLDYKSAGTLGQVEPLLTTDLIARVFSEELLINSKLAGPWRWSLGVFYRDAEDRDFQTLGPPGVFIPNNLDFSDTSESYALFGEVSRAFLDDRLELTAGARYFEDQVGTFENILFATDPRPLFRSESKFHKATPRAMVTWRPNTDLSFYGSYSEGFRSGTEQTLLSKLVYANFPPVEADTLKNYEVGVKTGLFDGALFLDTSVFYIDWKDIQQVIGIEVPGTNEGAGGIVNAGDASGPGLDVSLTARPLQTLQLSISFSYNDLTFDADVVDTSGLLFRKGDRTASSPKYTAGASAQYEFPLGSAFQARLLASAQYVSGQVTNMLTPQGLEQVAGDTMMYSRASFSVDSSQNWSATLFVDNAANEHGTPGGFTGGGLGERVRPRTIGVQVDYRFGR